MPNRIIASQASADRAPADHSNIFSNFFLRESYDFSKKIYHFRFLGPNRQNIELLLADPMTVFFRFADFFGRIELL